MDSILKCHSAWLCSYLFMDIVCLYHIIKWDHAGVYQCDLSWVVLVSSQHTSSTFWTTRGPLHGRRVSLGVGCLLMFMSIKILYIHSQWLPWHWMSKMILLFCLFGCDSLWMENKVKEMKSCFFQEYNLQSCVELVSFHHATKFTNETGVWQCCILI